MSNVDPQRIYQPLISTADISASNQVIGFRNRIINGAMRIDQRNVGTLVTIPASTGPYIQDRWLIYHNFANSTTAQQAILGNAGFPPKISAIPSVSPNALLWTNSTTATTSTSSIVQISHTIEANTLVDLNWGTSVARTVTLSFWVYTSVIGIYSVSLANVNANGSTDYVSTFTVTTANTWQKIVIVIPGPQIGTWATDTSPGIVLLWTLHGSTYSGIVTSTLNSWQTSTSSTNYQVASTQTANVGVTASSTFALTGVQLEIGAIATPFEWRPWETEMRMCQRYYEKSWDYGTAVGTNTTAGIYFGTAWSTGNLTGFQFRVEKRIIPSVNTYNPNSTTAGNVVQTGASTSTAVSYNSTSTKTMPFFGATVTSGSIYFWHFTANADF